LRVGGRAYRPLMSLERYNVVSLVVFKGVRRIDGS
jgi:hypothetical protein